MYLSDTTNTIVRIGGWIAVALVIGSVYVLTDSYLEQKRVEDGIVPLQTKTPVESAHSKDFIGVCSGMDLTSPEVHIVALSECMGRVRGFVDGHNMTVAMNQMAGAKSIKLWCMPTQVTTDQLLTNVMDWADSNPDDYVDIRASMDDANSATAIVIRALRTTYPCVNS